MFGRSTWRPYVLYAWRLASCTDACACERRGRSTTTHTPRRGVLIRSLVCAAPHRCEHGGVQCWLLVRKVPELTSGADEVEVVEQILVFPFPQIVEKLVCLLPQERLLLHTMSRLSTLPFPILSRRFRKQRILGSSVYSCSPVCSSIPNAFFGV